MSGRWIDQPAEDPWPGGGPPDPDRVARARAELIEWCESGYHRVVCFLMLAGDSEAAAQAAAQEAFAGWWSLLAASPTRWWEDLDGRQAWVRMTALRSRRAQAPETNVRPPANNRTGEPPLTSPDTGLGELSAQGRAVLLALRALDEEEREVMAFTLDGFAAADIPPALGITGQRVQAISTRARGKLQHALAAHLAPGVETAQDASDPNSRPAAGEQLSQFLASASRELLEHVAATVGVAGAYAEILSQGSLRVPPSAAAAPAATAITMRVHARELAAASADACVHAVSARSSIRDRSPGRAQAAASALTSALDQAGGLMRSLGPEVDLKLDLDLDIRLAASLIGALAPGDAPDWPHASELATALVSNLGTARMHTADLARGLAALPMDASAADLSGIGITDVSALDGVTWTRRTTWPPGIEGQVQARSREIRPGVYQVHIPYGSE